MTQTQQVTLAQMNEMPQGKLIEFLSRSDARILMNLATRIAGESQDRYQAEADKLIFNGLNTPCDRNMYSQLINAAEHAGMEHAHVSGFTALLTETDIMLNGRITPKDRLNNAC